MTKKYFIQIARILAKYNNDNLTNDFIELLSKLNSRFDKNKFKTYSSQIKSNVLDIILNI